MVEVYIYIKVHLISIIVFFYNNSYNGSSGTNSGDGSDIHKNNGTLNINNCALQSSLTCTNCLPTNTNPNFVNINDGDGVDNIWGTSDDGLNCNAHQLLIPETTLIYQE